MMVLQKTCIISPNFYSKTILCKKIDSKNILRNVGHAQKILSLIKPLNNQLLPMSHFHRINAMKSAILRDLELNKSSSTVILLKASQEIVPNVSTTMNPLKPLSAILPQISTEMTPLPLRVLDQIDSNINIRKAILLGSTISYILGRDASFKHNIKKLLALYHDSKDKSKIMGAIHVSAQEITPNNKLTNSAQMDIVYRSKKNQAELQKLLSFLGEDDFPLNRGLRIAIFQRMGYQFTGSRGVVVNVIAECTLHQHPGIETESALGKLRIENPQSPADFNFAQELTTAISHIKFIEQHKLVMLKEYTICTKTITSEEKKNSIFFTGQPNGDVASLYYTFPQHILIQIRTDIKNKELDLKTDFSACRLNVLYNMKGFQTNDSQMNAYIENTIKHLDNYSYDLETKNVLEILNNDNNTFNEKSTELQRFILNNASTKTHARMLMYFSEDLTIRPSYKRLSNLIRDEDVSSVNRDLFDPKDKTSAKYKKAFEDFTETVSYKEIYNGVMKELEANTLFNSKKLLDL